MEFAHNFKHRVMSTVGGKGAVVPRYTTMAQGVQHARVGKVEVQVPSIVLLR